MRSGVMIEEVEAFWDRRPCNISHGTAIPGTKQWSAQVTARKYFVEPHIPRFAQFDRWRGKKVLEVGCGIGTDFIEFFRSGAAISAVELSNESLGLLIKRLQEDVGISPLQFDWRCLICADAENFAFPCETFDLAYSFGVVHHTPNPQKILFGMRWALKENGELRIMLYSRWCFKRMFGGQPEAQANCPLARSYTVKQAKRLVESCGFIVENIAKAHIFPWRIEDYIQHRYVKRWQYRWMPKALFSWLERHFGEHLLIVARKA